MKKIVKSTWKKLLTAALALLMLISCFPLSHAAAASESVKELSHNGYKIFYSDDYFRHSSTEFDPHLATLSVLMTDSTAPRSNPVSTHDYNWYMQQPELLHKFFDTIGFDHFKVNDDYRTRSRFDSIGLAIARRKIDDFTVIAVTVRSGGYFLEWSNNVWLGDGTQSDYMHEGWYNAANKLIDFLDYYVDAQHITGRIKVWIAGFSRGGATSNLAAGLLDNMIEKKETVFSNGSTLAHDDLFAYTFEAPQGANYNSKTVKKPGDPIYNNIWNVVNPNDLVPKVAMSQYGFTRFGTDKYITTKFFDPANYKDNRNTFKYFFEKNDCNYANYKGDSLTMYGVPGSKTVSLLLNPWDISLTDECKLDTNKKNYDANIVATLLLDEAMKYIGSRNNYVKNYQTKMRDLMLCVMDDVKANGAAAVDGLKNGLIKSMVVLALTGSESMTVNSLKAFLSEDQAQSAAKSLYALAGVILAIFTERPNELITVALQSKNIFDNHEFNVNITHLMAQDSYYTQNSPVKTVSLRDNADFGRVSCKDMNQFDLYRCTSSGAKVVVTMKGSRFGDSDIKTCSDGYAVGYYSYLSENKEEIFMPAGQAYLINMCSLSLKPSHVTTFKAYHYYTGPNTLGLWKKEVSSYTNEDEFMDSDVIQRGIGLK